MAPSADRIKHPDNRANSLEWMRRFWITYRRG